MARRAGQWSRMGSDGDHGDPYAWPDLGVHQGGNGASRSRISGAGRDLVGHTWHGRLGGRHVITHVTVVGGTGQVRTLLYRRSA